MTRWEPTRRGGLRRHTGVAQEEGTRTLPSGQSATRSKWRPVVRIHPPVPRAKGSGKSKWRLAWAEPLGLPDCPYVIRWTAETPLFSARVHHWLGPDDVRAEHDHPWWFLTLVIRGGYTDLSSSGNTRLSAPCVRFRSASHRHVVLPDDGGAWTLLVTGRIFRRWGFWPDGKFVRANKWFLKYGHHPCR